MSFQVFPSNGNLITRGLKGKGLPVSEETSLLRQYTADCCFTCMNAGGTKSLVNHQVRCKSLRTLISGDKVHKSGLICSPNSGGTDCPGYQELN